MSFQDTNFKDPIRTLSTAEGKDLNLKYYNTDIHRAAFVLPEFARKVCDTNEPNLLQDNL